MESESGGSAAPKQIFIVGNSRSGTTMMGRVLGLHPLIFTFGELHFFEQMWSPLVNAPEVTSKQAVDLLSRLLAAQRGGYLNLVDPKEYLLEAERIGQRVDAPLTAPRVFEAFLDYEVGLQRKNIACEQTPRNVYYLNEILAYYPRAYVINMIRDPRDVLLSQKNRWRRRFLGSPQTLKRHTLRAWSNYHPITISILWNSGVKAVELRSDHPRIIEVKFEALVAEPEGKVRELCDFLGLEFYREMILVPLKGSSVHHDDPGRLGIDGRIAGHWKKGGLSPTELYLCEALTRKNLVRYDYDLSKQPPNYFLLPIYGMTWLLKSAMALLLNWHRMKDSLEAIRRRLGLL